jgi:hypothetical protein
MKDEIIQQLGIEGKIDAINNAGQTALDNIDTAKTNATQELETKQDELLEELGQQSVELRIEALEKENAEQQEELEALYNDFKPNTVSGETAIVRDGANGSKVEVIGDGNSYQETTEGYNLCDEANIEIGKAWNNASASNRAIWLIPVSPSTTYTLSHSNLGSIEGMYRGERPEKTTAGSGVSQITTNPATFTTSSSANWLCIQFNKTNISLADIQALKLQMELGSTAHTFEPYTNGASPNPEYKQPIEVIDTVNELPYSYANTTKTVN